MAVDEVGCAVGDVLGAGEKLSFACRLRSGAFLGGMMAVALLYSTSPAVSLSMTSLYCAKFASVACVSDVQKRVRGACRKQELV